MSTKQFKGTIRLSVLSTAMPNKDTLSAVSSRAPEEGAPVIEIVVQDDGPGFSPDAVAELFEPFFTTKQSGHGIGLPAIRSMVLQQNGAVRVVNQTKEQGGGARVSVFFSVSNAPEVQFDQIFAALHDDDSIPTIRVWIVDDDSFVVEFIKIALRGQGYDVDAFLTHAEVRARLGMIWRKEGGYTPPDLVIMDIQSDRMRSANVRRSREKRVVTEYGSAPGKKSGCFVDFF